MPISLPAVTLNPGTISRVSLTNLTGLQALKVTNGTPFDLTTSGFGVAGGNLIIPAGLEYLLHAEDGNTGHFDILPVNNVGASGTGIANLVAFLKDERVPQGTWPVTVPAQTVKANVSTVQTLSNEGSALGTLVIDMGPTLPGQVVSIWNDHFTWSVVQSGTAHQVLKGQTSGNPLQIGQNGDTSEVLGTLLVDQNVTVNANLNFINTGAVSRLFAAINSATNDATIWTNSDHGILHIRNSGNTADIATFADGSLFTTLLGELILNSGAQQTTNGSVAGTVTFYAPIWGTGLKVLIVVWAAYNSASVASYTFPSILNNWWYFTGNIGTETWDMFLSGSAKNQQDLTALGTGAAVRTFDAGHTGIHSGTIGQDTATTADSIQIGSTGGTAHSAILLVVGR